MTLRDVTAQYVIARCYRTAQTTISMTLAFMSLRASETSAAIHFVSLRANVCERSNLVKKMHYFLYKLLHLRHGLLRQIFCPFLPRNDMWGEKSLVKNLFCAFGTLFSMTCPYKKPFNCLKGFLLIN